MAIIGKKEFGDMFWKILNINFEVEVSNGIFADIYTKQNFFTNRQKKVFVPYLATKCRININEQISMNGITNKKYL